MSPLAIAGWIALGVALPFVAAALLLGVLAGRFAWERHRGDLIERAAAVRDGALEDALTDEDLADIAAWERELADQEEAGA